MIAPAAAPIAASRLVCFTVVVVGCAAALLPLVLPELLDDALRRVVFEVFVVRGRAGAGAAVLLRRPVAGAAAAFVRSAAEMESSRAFGFA